MVRHDLTATPCAYGRVRLIPQCLAEPELADLRAQLDGMLRGQASVPNRRLREVGQELGTLGNWRRSASARKYPPFGTEAGCCPIEVTAARVACYARRRTGGDGPGLGWLPNIGDRFVRVVCPGVAPAHGAWDLLRGTDQLTASTVRPGGRAGRRTRSTVFPAWESMVMVPPWRSTTVRRAMSRPRPVPLPASLVV